MNEMARIVSAEPVIHGVLKIVWNDGYEGVVDLRPVIARGKIFNYLASPDHFRDVRVGEYGHAVYWVNDEGNEIDFGTDSLRETAEKQAEMHALAG